MRVLLDTNVLIALEPTHPGDVEALTPSAAELTRLMSEGGHLALIHPASLEELRHDRDPDRRAMREVLAAKYPQLSPAPPMTAGIERVLGRAPDDSHDWIDNRLLAALNAEAVSYLVTQDDGIHRKARRLQLDGRVLTIRDALEVFQTLLGLTPHPPPFVESLKAYELDATDPIFESLRGEYPGFDDWLARCKREARKCWVIRDHASPGYGGLLLVKEQDDQLGVGGKTLKISTFKVAPSHRGNRYGELLLKTAFEFASANSYTSAFVTVFPRHLQLIGLFEDFGFFRWADTTNLGERIYVKFLEATPDEVQSLDSLAFHIAFGPPALKPEAGRIFLVPIRPVYHALLFPDLQRQQEFLPQSLPYGNAIRKAYLSKSKIRQLRGGDTLLFYRSHDFQEVDCVGVVEEVRVSPDPTEVANYVGQRTVYSLEEIQRMATTDILAILFRQDRAVFPPISLSELIEQGAIRGHPQSISGVREEAFEWVTRRLSA